MHKTFTHTATIYSSSIYSILLRMAVVLFIIYIGLLAFVMTYGVLSMRAVQVVQDTRARVGTLETMYLAKISNINDMQPQKNGFQKPLHVGYVINTRPAVSIRTQ